MPPEEEIITGANEGDSPGSKKGAKNGDSPSAEEKAAELERKTTENKNLKTKLDSLTQERDDLLRKQEEGNLTEEEEDELADSRAKIKELAGKIKQSKEYAPWEEIIDERAEKKAADILLNSRLSEANDLIEDAAVQYGYANWDMDERDFKEAVEKYAKEVSPFCKRYVGKSPQRRNAMAIRDWKREQDRLGKLTEREKKVKEEEEKTQRFRETGGRVARDKNVDQRFENAKTGVDKAGVIADLISGNVGTEEE